MSIVAPITGVPGVRAAKTATHRIIFRGGWITDILPLGKLIDGTKASDPGNTPQVDVLRAGVLMGKITASSKYGTSVIDTTTVLNAAGDTTVTLSVAGATELVRRQGATGTFTLTGPPVANGVTVSQTVTYSAVVVATGVVTVTALGAASVLGSFVGPTDGSQTPITMVPDSYGLKVSDTDGTRQDVQFPELPIAGTLTAAQLIPWPTDTSLQRWIQARLNDINGGQFIFDTRY